MAFKKNKKLTKQRLLYDKDNQSNRPKLYRKVMSVDKLGGSVQIFSFLLTPSLLHALSPVSELFIYFTATDPTSWAEVVNIHCLCLLVPANHCPGLTSTWIERNSSSHLYSDFSIALMYG